MEICVTGTADRETLFPWWKDVSEGQQTQKDITLRAIESRGVELARWDFRGGLPIAWDPGDLADADVVMTGHTHEVDNELHDGRLFLNPGECCGWVSGRCTVAVLDTDSLSAEVIEVTP